MNAIVARIQDEPILITTLVGALIELAIVFGVPISPEQKVAIGLAVAAVLAFFGRSKVSPV